MDLIKSNKDGVKGCFNGHLYVVKYAGKQKISWRCTKASALKCPGTCKSNLNFMNPYECIPHMDKCENDETGVEVAKCINKILNRTCEYRIKPAKIVASEIDKLDDSTKARMPPVDFVKRRIRRKKSKLKSVSSDPYNSLVTKIEL